MSQFLGAVHLDRRARSLHFRGNSREILHMGSEEYGFAIARWFQNIVPAGIDQTTADKSDIAGREKCRQLAHRVQQKNVLGKETVSTRKASALKFEYAALQQALHFSESIGRAVRQNHG